MTSNSINGASRPAINRRFRLQWESAQNAHVLLYPEGMIKLNTSAGEILKRCDGQATIADITASLEQSFSTSGLSDEVIAFIAMAVENKWVAVL
ncbi:MAG: pyrroloquinoline quinone biosynthesis protein [Gammaproteobacteria bacterium]|nr:pyrroloquinoline quinone biosynthesis protein [Gammaproteobacteria bacterium]